LYLENVQNEEINEKNEDLLSSLLNDQNEEVNPEELIKNELKYSFILYNSLQRIFNAAPSLFEFDDIEEENLKIQVDSLKNNDIYETNENKQ